MVPAQAHRPTAAEGHTAQVQAEDLSLDTHAEDTGLTSPGALCLKTQNLTLNLARCFIPAY